MDFIVHIQAIIKLIYTGSQHSQHKLQVELEPVENKFRKNKKISDPVRNVGALS